ncbi:predicted protein [Nematostella vectensis]|uniref:Ubiquitin conjugation factor E4 A n=1 Tax=Nematostella vectensis TaxID=45351 RepID=A7RUX2_NEMVE|nr:predicted protein [Nematostella vectensis]|eukprot:XP_001636888.1 predicted protein [Nematostella vectensis]
MSSQEQSIEGLASNPFLALFTEHPSPSLSQPLIPGGVSTSSALAPPVQISSKQQDEEIRNISTADGESQEQILNDLLQRIFLITLKNDHDRLGCKAVGGLPKRCVYLRDSALDSETSLLSFANIDQALLERLTMQYPRNNVVITGRARSMSVLDEIEAGEGDIVKYLVQCFFRARTDATKLKVKQPEIFKHAENAKKLALSYVGTCMLSSEMFPNQNGHKQLFSLLMSSQDNRDIYQFMGDFVKEYTDADEVEMIFLPLIELLAEKQSEFDLVKPQTFQYLDFLLFISRQSHIAELLTKTSWLPPKPLPIFRNQPSISGRAFEKQTLLGGFLGLTSIATDPTKPSMMSELFATTLADDGFFLNLGTAMLRLCQPFLDPSSPKLLKIDPRYCAVAVTESSITQEDTPIHCIGLNEETRLIIPQDESTVSVEPTPAFGFVTECFFMTHYCLQLGFGKICEKYKSLMTRLSELQRVYQSTYDQGGESSLAGRLKDKFELGIIQQLSLKTHLLNPSMIELTLRFYIATTSWINQVALAGDNFLEMTEFVEVAMPLADQTPAALLFVPEFILDNMADFIIFLRHFSEETLETAGKGLHHLLTFFVIYMGSPERVKNPHLRAKLAEALECLVPVQREPREGQSPVTVYHRQLAFEQHAEAKKHLPCALLSLFVDIEFTGHSMQFEQKFGYRHHMYTVLEYLWSMQEYKQSILDLCSEYHRQLAFEQHAEAKKHLPCALLSLFVDIEFTGHSMQFEQKFGYRHHMYTVLEYLWSMQEYKQSILDLCSEMQQKNENSIILRFISLLINDAIYLLDESLDYMAQIKKKQLEEAEQESETLSEQERETRQRAFSQLSQMATSHNILGCKTVHTLSYLTTELKEPFVCSCVCSRIAAMLNYFLLQLVGPKMSKLKVKDFTEFHFKPQQLVSDIVDIYINLGTSEAFCKEVGRDERSYKPDLFIQAERVLKLIGRPASVLFQINEVARKVQEHLEEEEELPEPPEDYQDPIMNTLMRCPVRLPTSGKIMDKEIISRHLLSDQSDPFNRKHLTVSMLEPEEDLKAEIEEWIARNSTKSKGKSAGNDQKEMQS